MKSLKRIILLSVTSCIAVSMSGCVYSKNKNWSDLNQEEKEEVRQVLDEVKEELENDLKE